MTKHVTNPIRNCIPKGWRLAWFAAVAIAIGAPFQQIKAANPLPPLQTKDKVSARLGVFQGGSHFSAETGGHTGKAGDYAVDFNAGGSGPVHIPDGTFLNAATAHDELTIAFWGKKYDIAAASAFWAVSPTSNNGERGYQAHVPWSDSNIYFDTAGCCGADTRIAANISTFGSYSGDPTWWNDWHHFVFSKKGDDKQIWIDGVLFLEGNAASSQAAAPLPTDFTEIYIGADNTGVGNLYHGLVDDFTIFSTQLGETDITSLVSGTLPSALPSSTGLMAYWDFNDFPAEGIFTSLSPTPDTTAAAPDLVQVVHIDGGTVWDQSNVSLKVDDVPVTISFAKNGKTATVSYVPSPLFAIESTHKATLTYLVSGQQKTLEWSFTVGDYTKDTVAARVGTLTGGSLYTTNSGGRTGQPGDYGIDFGKGGSGPIVVGNVGFLNTAATNDEISIGFWAKKYDAADSSAFWGVAPSSGGGRGIQAHLPVGGQIYYDTAGCCDPTNRINADISTFANYSGDATWWNDWHYYVFSKKGEDKQIWIDGVLFLEGNADSGAPAAPLPTDFTKLFIGSDGGGALLHAVIDDFAVFSTQLSTTDINSIVNGTKPSALPAATGLLALWEFNDLSTNGAFVSFTPTPNSTNALPAVLQVVQQQGTTLWDLSKVSLSVDGAPVTAQVTRNGGVGSKVTVTYLPAPPLSTGAHTATITYPLGAGLATKDWQFSVAPYFGFSKDVVASHIGIFEGKAGFSQGHTSQPGDYGVDLTTAGGPVIVQDGSFLNIASTNDEMSFALWVKKYDIAQGSAFWGIAPSSGGARGWQAHIPWDNNNIYFDTAGCCDPTNRINADVTTTFPDYTGSFAWWTEWHFLVFSKKADDKQIWIDGKLFLEGNTDTGAAAAPLPTDFTTLMIGSDNNGAGLFHAVVDDFSVFSKQLSEADITALFNGTNPPALPSSDGLLAYWNFNDLPAEGRFLSMTPGVNETNAAPNLIKIVHLQGTAWDLSKVSLKVDGTPVTASVTKTGNEVTVQYVPSTLFAANSTHTATLTYPDLTGALVTKDWQFTVGTYTKDVLHQYVGVLTGAAAFTADAGGHSGKAGDKAIDLGKTQAGQSVHIPDATFINAAATNDEFAVAGWQKLWSVANAGFFWATSPSANAGKRGWGVSPWSNQHIYFDTAGCCDAAIQRVDGDVTTFTGYSGDVSWWQDWHYFVFQKNLSTKEIWIDGQLLITGDNTGALPTDFDEAWIGLDSADNARMQGIVDDVALFGTSLDEATIGQLFSGTLPTALPASAKLLAYWDFNDGAATVTAPKIDKISITGQSVKIEWSAAGAVLQSAPSLTAPATWSDVTGATTPYTITVTGTAQFYRLRQ